MALCALTFAEYLHSIIAAALECLSAWVFIAFVVLYLQVFSVFLEIGSTAFYFGWLLRGFLSTSSGRKSKRKNVPAN